jgi:hypothetical protein
MKEGILKYEVTLNGETVLMDLDIDHTQSTINAVTKKFADTVGTGHDGRYLVTDKSEGTIKGQIELYSYPGGNHWVIYIHLAE